MNILLIGANFKNKGAEAMALTAVREFHSRLPGCSITVASYAKQESILYGAHRLDERTSFTLIRNNKGPSTALKILGRALTGQPPGGDQYLEALESADVVIDISGFALTDKRPLLRRIVFGLEILTARIFKKPFVIFTQALGPFNQWSTRVLGRLTLPLASLICARGESTLKFLQTLSLPSSVRIIRCADSAYLFSAEQAKSPIRTTQRPLVGLVPNINNYERSGESYLIQLKNIVDFATEQLGVKVVILCHEHYENRKGDSWLAEEISKAVKSRDAVETVSGRHSAAELKQAIAELDLLIASRFHSLVAANSLAVPSIALAWAHKYHELFAEAGVPHLVVDSENLSPEACLAKVRMAWETREEIAKTLKARGPALRSSAATAYDEVVALFSQSSDAEISRKGVA
jgi:colanic acid/amylovoran biosynthesis protein